MVMSEGSLEFEKGVYSAREMMQIIPIKDDGGITELYAKNTWTEQVLPNASRKTAISLGQTLAISVVVEGYEIPSAW